jgi:hypothetical protein
VASLAQQLARDIHDSVAHANLWHVSHQVFGEPLTMRMRAWGEGEDAEEGGPFPVIRDLRAVHNVAGFLAQQRQAKSNRAGVEFKVAPPC